MRGSGVSANRRVAVVFGLLILVTLGPIVAADTAQPASRYALTAALAEHHTVDLGRYRHDLGLDRAVYRGHLRSDKAPGQPVLAVPIYLVGRALGAQSAIHSREHGDLGLWWSTLWSALVPFTLLLGLMFLVCTRFVSRRAALAVVVALAVCSIMVPVAVNLFGHDLAALFAFGAWLAIEPDTPAPGRIALGGLLAGLAVFTEYETGIILVVLAAYALVRHRRRIGWFLLGVAAPLGALAWYQSAAFGAPWRTPSTFFAGTIQGTTRGGYTIPGIGGLWSVLFGNRGLWIGAPVALLALGGAVWALGNCTGAARRHAIVGLSVLIPYLVLCAGWSGFKLLEDPGPRFLVPALPFLAVPLAVIWDRVWRPAVLLAAWGALIAWSAAFTFLLLGIGQSALPELPRRVWRGDFPPTVWSMAFGRAGVVVYAVSVAGAIALLARELRRPEVGTEQMFAPSPATQ